MKIAVVGGGVFGSMIAFTLAQNTKHNVHLYERGPTLMQAASGINQYRLHRGYHYPRSHETTSSLLHSNSLFVEVFGKALLKDISNYYCIASEGILTSVERYLTFCNDHALEYQFCDLDIVNKSKIDLCIKVREDLFDPQKLAEI